jgi:hypothetical protein
MVDSSTFISAKGKPIDIQKLVIAYWHTFERVCPKHEPNGLSKVKFLHNIIEGKALAQVYKLNFSSLT